MPKSFRETIVGAWELVEYTLNDANGKRYHPMGRNCTGILMYTPDGYVSAQMMAQGRPAYAGGDLHNGTTAEMAAAANGYLAYSGQYEVNEKSHTLTHHMAVSMNPTWDGQSQERYVKLDGDTITITASVNSAVLVWKRAKDHSGN